MLKVYESSKKISNSECAWRNRNNYYYFISLIKNEFSFTTLWRAIKREIGILEYVKNCHLSLAE